ncbi:nitronate monooxygenase [Pseudomonas sp. F1_0610]|uniref:NAD(P)H-dependent flavin oxidoreductase n=1 Tax=Pseudomonas sp. F1_0610 TaxID=3114284 RepID=UPI0039C2E6AE
MQQSLLELLGIQYPIIQAPMAGTSTVSLAAAVCNAGGLGSLGLGSASVENARAQIRALKAATNKPFNINFFCHQAAPRDRAQEQRWLAHLAPYFAEFGAVAPLELSEDYASFINNTAMLEMLLEERPAIVSFHFGLPNIKDIEVLKEAGICLLGCATSLQEAQVIEQAGLDGIIAQGFEAGGHRGVFNVKDDLQLGLFSLLQLLKKHCSLPLIAAGGIMDGSGIANVLKMGASAAQLGTAFILCPESAANPQYRAALSSAKAYQTAVTAVISGRPARGLVNRMHQELEQFCADLPGYPAVYSAGKALHAAASEQASADFAAHWAGQSAPLAREMPADMLIKTLVCELENAI